MLPVFKMASSLRYGMPSDIPGAVDWYDDVHDEYARRRKSPKTRRISREDMMSRFIGHGRELTPRHARRREGQRSKETGQGSTTTPEAEKIRRSEQKRHSSSNNCSEALNRSRRPGVQTVHRDYVKAYNRQDSETGSDVFEEIIDAGIGVKLNRRVTEGSLEGFRCWGSPDLSMLAESDEKLHKGPGKPYKLTPVVPFKADW